MTCQGKVYNKKDRVPKSCNLIGVEKEIEHKITQVQPCFHGIPGLSCLAGTLPNNFACHQFCKDKDNLRRLSRWKNGKKNKNERICKGLSIRYLMI